MDTQDSRVDVKYDAQDQLSLERGELSIFGKVNFAFYDFVCESADDILGKVLIGSLSRHTI